MKRDLPSCPSKEPSDLCRPCDDPPSRWGVSVIKLNAKGGSSLNLRIKRNSKEKFLVFYMKYLCRALRAVVSFSSELLRRRALEGSPPTISEVLLPLCEVL